jgi:hypothetical protein
MNASPATLSRPARAERRAAPARRAGGAGIAVTSGALLRGARMAAELWSRFLFRPVPAHALAAFRLTFGLYFLIYLLAFAPRLFVSFSSAGIPIPYLIPDWSLPPALCLLAYGAVVAAGVAFTLGWRTGWITPLLLLGYLYFYLLGIAVKNTAHERLNLLVLGLACLARLDAVWAVRPTGRPDADGVCRVPVWPVRLITLQIAFLYFGAGWWKLNNPKWHSGDLLFYNFIGDWATPLAFWVARTLPNGPAWTAMSWGVIAWELALGLALFIPALRMAAVITGTLFHLSVWALLGIPEFMNCVACYPLFFPPEQVRATGRRLFGGLGRTLEGWARN